MDITQKELARRAGLSQRAVSMALKRDPRLSPTTVERVLHLAKEAGYRPNMAAKAIRSGRTNNITVVLSANNANSRLTIPFIYALMAELEQHDLHLSIAQVPDAKLTRRDSLPRLLSELAADGLIINYLEHIPPALIELVEQSNQPAVWVGARLKQDCVYPDAWMAGDMATRHLIDLGHRRIGYFMPYNQRRDHSDQHYSWLDRYDAYAELMRQNGLPPTRWEDIEGAESPLAAAERMLAGKDRPTGVICSWQSSLPPLIYAAGLAGLRVPEDLSVVLLSDPHPDTPMPMTRVAFDFEARARATVESLTRKIKSPGSKPRPPIAVPPQLIVGRSTAPPKAG